MSIECPKCGNQTSVIDSRQYRQDNINGMIRRRRHCDKCEHRFTTYEVHESVILEMLRLEKEVETMQTAFRRSLGITIPAPERPLRGVPTPVKLLRQLEKK